MGAILPISRPWGMGGGGGSMPPVLSPVAELEQATGVPMGRVLQIPLPEIEPIPSALQFNPLGQVNTSAIQSNVVIPGASADISPSNMGVVNSLTLFITNMLANTSVTWTLFYQTNPVPGFVNLPIFPRVAPFVSNTYEILYRVNGAGTFTVQFTNNDGGSYLIGAAFSGWQWPAAMDKLWKTNGGV